MKKKTLILLPLLFSLFSCGGIVLDSTDNGNNSNNSNEDKPISMPTPTTSQDNNYNELESTIIDLKDNQSTVTNNNGFAVVDKNKIYITGEGIYDFSGTLSDGQIIVNPADENAKIELNLNGVNISCSTGACIAIMNGDKTEISASKDTKNYLVDNRKTDEDNLDLTKGVIHGYTDLEIKGRGYLEVNSEYNNGISTTKDLHIKNLTLKAKAKNTALKGNDSLTIESGTFEIISTLGDGLKTENSDVSNKGNQRGTIEIMGGELNIYSACDAIDASYDVKIYNDPTINIYTEDYSPYSEEVTVTEEKTLYLSVPNSSGNRPGSNSTNVDLNSVYFAANYLYSDGTTTWENASKMSSSGMSRKTYYSLNKPTNAEKVTFYCFDSSQTSPSTDTYKYVSETLTIPDSHDMYAISSFSSTNIKGSWSNYSTSSTGGGFGGGMQEGNPEASDYSCKGIKADNQINIEGGKLSISSHDDAIHAKNDTLLMSNVYGLGDVNISNGTIDITGEDDGIHADNSLNITGGTIKINKSYEGVEGNQITISGGDLYVIASDDGINATSSMNITGGISYFEAEGDVIDSNGTITMSGGVVFAQGPSSGGNGLLDFDKSFTFSGGLLLGLGTSDMAQKPTGNGATVTTSNISINVNSYIIAKNGNNVVAAMKVKKSNLRYAVLAYSSSYGSGLTITSGTSISNSLVNDSYYVI